MSSQDSQTVVRTLIHQFVARHNNVAPDTLPALLGERDLFAEGLLDSFGFVELLTYLADETGRELDLSDIDPSELTLVDRLIGQFTADASS